MIWSIAEASSEPMLFLAASGAAFVAPAVPRDLAGTAVVAPVAPMGLAGTAVVAPAAPVSPGPVGLAPAA